MLFTGRLTADAEVKELKNDRKVTNFTVALNYTYKNKDGEKKEKAAFVDCAYWVNHGLAIYLTKGAIVEINGWMEAEAYLSNKDKLPKSRLVCSVDKIKLFATVGTAEQKAEAKPAAVAANGADSDDDDLPF